MTDITWYGHSAFKITTGGVNFVVDPFLNGNPTCPISWQDIGQVDAVLLTHDHGDHVGQTVEICKQTGATLCTVVGTAERMVEAGVPLGQVCNGIGFNIGGSVYVAGARITMVPAFHTSESGTPTGFIVTMPDGFTWYHAGDTCVYGDMAMWGNLYPLDVALLPIGGVFTMDSEQAAVACNLLRPRHVIPMHWGTFPALHPNTESFKEALIKNGCRATCVDMQPGASVSLTAEKG